MALTIGERLGPYEILAPLGAGGMGEVYKARDTRLDRTVAVKILPEHLAKDSEHRERFEREARAVSSLNHPHICTLHDIGQQDGIDFIVMEYIEGETLADCLVRGPLPLARALEYGIQIADGLDKAHRQGVVHRDLKPGNLMVTKPGIKLLDFGLAKFRQESLAVSEDSEQATRQKPLTGAGTVLGTIQYMAPEQLEGKEADSRTDIFAFGALLYEMVTGRRAFSGESQASVIASIMNNEPTSVTELQPLTPAGLDRTLAKCLAKDPDRRWQSAGDLTDALRWLAEPPSGATLAIETAPRGQSRIAKGRLAWAAGGFLAGALAALLFTGFPESSERIAAMTHAVVPLAPHQQLVGGVMGSVPFAISPDGTEIAYTVSEGTTRQLYVQSLNEFGARQIPESEGANNPFFSPDGQWVGFFRRDGLYKASNAGGAPVRVSDGPAIGSGADWGRDGTIVYSSLRELFRVSADGGTPERLGNARDDVSLNNGPADPSRRKPPSRSPAKK